VIRCGCVYDGGWSCRCRCCGCCRRTSTSITNSTTPTAVFAGYLRECPQYGSAGIVRWTTRDRSQLWKLQLEKSAGVETTPMGKGKVRLCSPRNDGYLFKWWVKVDSRISASVEGRDDDGEVGLGSEIASTTSSSLDICTSPSLESRATCR